MDAPQPTAQAPHNFTATKDSPLPTPATHCPHRPCRRRRTIAIVCGGLVLLSLLSVALNILVRWLILQPQPGTYALKDANLNVFKLTHVDNTSYSLDADVDFTLLFSNPNKRMGLNVKDVTVQALIFNGDEIGVSAAVPSFHQARRSDTTVVAGVRAVKKVLTETVFRALQAEIERNDITVRVVVRGRVRSDDAWYASMHHGRRIRLTCVVNLTAPQVGTNRTAVIGKRCEW